MLQALWFLARLSALAFAVIWLSQRPGDVTLRWLGYEIETSVGVLAAGIALLLLLWSVAYRLYRAAITAPVQLRRLRVSARREKGYRVLTSGLVAIAAGDGQAAEKCAKTALRLIPDAPLARLLTAQAALLNGNAPKARREFTALLENDDTAFFGVRGLLSEALEAEDVEGALALARRAETIQPKRRWVLRTLFDLETRAQHWEKADAALKKGEKAGVFDAKAALRHRRALWTAAAIDDARQGRDATARKWAEKAFSLDPGFAPAALLFADLCQQAGKRRGAIKALEKAWETAPHPDLAKRWAALMPSGKKPASVYDQGKDAYDWIKKLCDLRPEHRDSRRALGSAALDAKMWKEAREHLISGSDYRLLARLEQEETGNEIKARHWMEKAADHPPEPRWICTACNHAESAWSPLCPECKAFNQQEWMIPGAGIAHKTIAPAPESALFSTSSLAR